ncbi:MAG: hypothetical protein L3J39_19435 [Verrucomicrobiales bacterium]|nr:hypothetical protein [Verrucomicrobiales bacterium]
MTSLAIHQVRIREGEDNEGEGDASVKARLWVGEVTSALEQAVQAGVNQLNQTNSYDGGALF